MFELSVKKAFTRHERQMLPLSEDEMGVLMGGFSNFPKAKNKTVNSAHDSSSSITSETPTLKASRFNSFIPYEGKILGFNAFTQRFLIMEPMLLDLLNAATQEQNINDFCRPL